MCRFMFSALPSVRRYLARWTVLAVFLRSEAKRAPGGFISDYGKSLVAGPVLGGLREFGHSVFQPANWKREMATNSSAISDGSGAASSLAAALSGLHLTDHLLPVEGDAPTLTSEPTLKDLGRPNLFYGTDDAWTEWSFVTRAWILANNIMTEDNLLRIEAHQSDIDWRLMFQKFIWSRRENCTWR